MSASLDTVKQLVKARKFAEAKQLVSSMDLPNGDQWLNHIDQIEMKARATAKAAPAKTHAAQAKKPLPHEGKKVLPKGKPTNPREILAARSALRGRAQLVMWLWGGKSMGLINNYRRLNQTGLFALLGIIYVSLVIAWIPCFGLTYLLLDRLFKTSSTNFVGLVLCAIVPVLLPFTPRILAWVQQEQYDKWAEEYAQTRREILG